MVLDKGKGCRIPGRIAAGLKGGAQTAGREAGCIRLALDQVLACKVHDHAAVIFLGNKSVMLFSCRAGQRLEPVGVMGCPHIDGPVFHGLSDLVCCIDIQGLIFLQTLLPGFVGCRRQAFAHLLFVEYIAGEHRLESFFSVHLCLLFVMSGENLISNYNPAAFIRKLFFSYN